jgi:hypothetical protein
MTSCSAACPVCRTNPNPPCCAIFANPNMTQHSLRLMQTPSWHSPEHIKLKQLDWNNIRVISAVLGQSVALDFYAR